MNNSMTTRNISIANYAAGQWLLLLVIGLLYISGASIITDNEISSRGLTSAFQQLMMFAFPVTFHFFSTLNEYDLDNNFIMVPIMLIHVLGYLAATAYFPFIAYSSAKTNFGRLTRVTLVMVAIYLMNDIMCGYAERLI